MPHRLKIAAILPYVFSITLLFALAPRAEAGRKLRLISRAFANGAAIPVEYTCAGDNNSPALEWTGVPGGSRSLALIVKDPDAPGGTFIHWVLYNMPPGRSSLPADVPKEDNIPDGGDQGVNGADGIGYHGPCPPPGSPHHYHFRLYAVDTKLDLKPGASADQLEDAMRKHVVAETDLVGTFGR
jgi:Raf kinase inhibitor-like YbhB/YbcL family protein